MKIPGIPLHIAGTNKIISTMKAQPRKPTSLINFFTCVFILSMLAGIFLLLPHASSEESVRYQGRVVKVIDGDSITILVEKQQIKIRLGEIDTPERGQPYWRVSRKALEKLVAGKTITAIQTDIDRYKRIVAHVYIDDLWVNEQMVKDGYAWVYPKYAKSESIYLAEEYAKANKLGIWSLPESERIPPWKWRRMN